MMSLITLENMEFYAYHGCLEHEKQHGNTFLVTVSFELDTLVAGKTDYIEDTLNYQQVYDLVKEQMEIPSNLIEHVVQRVLDKLISKFPIVSYFIVKLSKLNPPLGGKVEQVSIVVSNKK